MVSRLKGTNLGKQVYLSGPMRGHHNFNFQAFLDAAKELTELGYKVYNPAEMELRRGFDPTTGEYADGREMTIRELMFDDLTWICSFADKVVVLPGWENSKGATAEVACARAIGVEVIELREVGTSG